MDNNQRKSGAILSYISIFLSTLVQLLYTPLLIRMMGQSEYGLYSLVSSVIGYISVLDLGFGNAIVVYTSKYREQGKYNEEKKLLGMFKIIFIILGIIAGIMGILLYFLSPNMFGNTMNSRELYKIKVMMLILAFNLFITFAFNIYSAIITSYEKFVFQKTLAILNTLLKPLIMVPLLFLGFKSITMSVVITVVNIAICISNYTYCKKRLNIKIKYNGFDKKIFKIIFGYSIFIFLGNIVDKVNWSVDQFILGVVCGTTAVSVYSVSSSITILFINLSTAISNVFLPKISKMTAKEIDKTKLTNEMIKVGRLQNYVIFLAVTGLILFGKEFIIWWVGKEYIKSYYITLILVIPVCFPLIQNLGLSIMQALNKYKFKSISTFVMSIINTIISFFLAKEYGPIGAAIGTAGALILCNIIIINIYYAKVIKLNIIRFWKEIIKQSVPLLIPIIIILLIINITSITGIISVLIYGTIYVILYSITAYYISMNNYEKEIVQSLLNKVGIKICKN